MLSCEYFRGAATAPGQPGQPVTVSTTPCASVVRRLVPAPANGALTRRSRLATLRIHLSIKMKG